MWSSARSCSSSPVAFERYFGEWAEMRVVFEAGSQANWGYRLLERLEHGPLMADTHRLALITQSLSKDDRTDAERLAELRLRLPKMLNPIQPCSRSAFEADTERAAPLGPNFIEHRVDEMTPPECGWKPGRTFAND